MPYRKNYNKKNNRIVKRKKKSNLYKPQTVQRLLSSKYRLVKMRYAEGATINPGAAGILNTYVFSANSIYDPNVSSTGHQPLMHDQLITFYNHYCVTRSKIHVTFTPSTATIEPVSTVGIKLNDVNNFSASDPDTIVEQDDTCYRMMYTGSNNPVKLTKVYNAKTFFNIKDIKDNLDRLGSNFGANPTEQAYFMVFAGNQHAYDGAAIYINVLIEYEVLVSEPAEVIGS